MAVVGELNILVWRGTCETLAARAAKRCAQSHTFYVDLYSDAIDKAISSLSQSQRKLALHIAREWEYATLTERVAQQRWNAANGYCTHGIELCRCPLGCTSADEDSVGQGNELA